MTNNERECLIHKLNETIEKIQNIENCIKSHNKDDSQILEWFEIELILLNNSKIMIEKSLINDCIEEL